MSASATFLVHFADAPRGSLFIIFMLALSRLCRLLSAALLCHAYVSRLLIGWRDIIAKKKVCISWLPARRSSARWTSLLRYRFDFHLPSYHYRFCFSHFADFRVIERNMSRLRSMPPLHYYCFSGDVSPCAILVALSVPAAKRLACRLSSACLGINGRRERRYIAYAALYYFMMLLQQQANIDLAFGIQSRKLLLFESSS